jgi:radical SAM protein with 4Fe4S-binding SPASM domain
VYAADQYDSLNDLSQGKDKGLKIVYNLKNKKNPCDRLKNLTFNSNGTIGACGCVSSIGLENSRLILGDVDNDISTINQKREKIVLDWKNNQKIPKECQHCAFYDA